jgi:hypothetical protein
MCFACVVPFFFFSLSASLISPNLQTSNHLTSPKLCPQKALELEPISGRLLLRGIISVSRTFQIAAVAVAASENAFHLILTCII